MGLHVDIHEKLEKEGGQLLVVSVPPVAGKPPLWKVQLVWGGLDDGNFTHNAIGEGPTFKAAQQDMLRDGERDDGITKKERSDNV